MKESSFPALAAVANSCSRVVVLGAHALPSVGFALMQKVFKKIKTGRSFIRTGQTPGSPPCRPTAHANFLLIEKHNAQAQSRLAHIPNLAGSRAGALPCRRAAALRAMMGVALATAGVPFLHPFIRKLFVLNGTHEIASLSLGKQKG